MPTNTSDI